MPVIKKTRKRMLRGGAVQASSAIKDVDVKEVNKAAPTPAVTAPAVSPAVNAVGEPTVTAVTAPTVGEPAVTAVTAPAVGEPVVTAVSPAVSTVGEPAVSEVVAPEAEAAAQNTSNVSAQEEANKKETEEKTEQASKQQGENQPSEAGTENQPSEAGRENQPSEAGAENQPSEAGTENQPSEAGAENQPSEAGTENQPSASEAGAENQPSASEAGAENQPSEAENQPSASEAGAENQPSASEAAGEKKDEVSEAEENKPVPDTLNCLQNASLLSTVPAECIIPDKVPAFKQLVQAAIYQPLAEAGAEMASNALQATGNAALVDAATTAALGPEQAALLNTLSKDPAVAAELEKFQDKLSNAVAQSIDTASETVTRPAEEAVGRLTTGAAETVAKAVSDIPPVGLVLSAATAAQTGVKAVEDATDIAKKLEEAASPVTQVMGEVGELSNALDNAAKNAIPEVPEVPTVDVPTPKVEVPTVDVPKVEVPTVDVPKVEVPKVEVPEVPKVEVPEVPKVEVPTPKVETPKISEGAEVPAPKVSEGAEVPEAPTQKPKVGGSRKRHRIHKLSRRIERTLRRVQKKYGLHHSDTKKSFLTRTLRRGT